jgi:hypothetical protein
MIPSTDDEKPGEQALSGAGGIRSEEHVSEDPAIGRGVPAEYLIDGFSRARGRFVEAAARGEPEVETFIPLFEALNWAAAIEAKIRDDAKDRGERAYDTATPDGQLLLAMRFVRGRVHHQWALALEPVDVPVATITVQLGTGMGRSGVRPPAVVRDWHWLPVERLRLPRKGREHKNKEKAYRCLLAGHPVRETLEQLAPTLDRLCAV